MDRDPEHRRSATCGLSRSSIGGNPLHEAWVDSAILTHSKYWGMAFTMVLWACICLVSTYDLDTEDMITCTRRSLAEARIDHLVLVVLMHEPVSKVEI